MTQSSRYTVVTTEMVASATEQYLSGSARMLHLIVNQRVDGVIWGTQRAERKQIIQAIEIMLDKNPSADAAAALKILRQHILDLPFIVPGGGF